MGHVIPNKVRPGGASAGEMLRPAAYRTGLRAVGALLLGLGLTVIALARVIVDRGHPLPALVSAAIMLPVAFVLLFRTARAGVFTSQRGIRVLNTWKTLEIPWDEIDRFSVGSMRYWAARIGIAELRDGRRIKLVGITGSDTDRPGGSSNRDPDVEIEKLNAVLAQRLKQTS